MLAFAVKRVGLARADSSQRDVMEKNSRSIDETRRSWRGEVRAYILDHPELFPGAVSASRRSLTDAIEDNEGKLQRVAESLKATYGSPRLGNQKEPVDELIYIILSRKTREDAYSDAFSRLKRAFKSWDDLLGSPPERVNELIFSSGLSGKKTLGILRALEILTETFGSCTMEPAKAWPPERLFEFLCSLPEVGPKSAYCIMLFAFDLAEFPVDTHVGRCLSRISPFSGLGLDIRGFGHKKLQRILPPLVPPHLRYGLHVDLVAHGRSICLFRQPVCEECPIRSFCAYGNRTAPWDSSR